jgi:hypothetical protein
VCPVAELGAEVNEAGYLNIVISQPGAAVKNSYADYDQKWNEFFALL